MEAIANIRLQKAMKTIYASRQYYKELKEFSCSVTANVNLNDFPLAAKRPQTGAKTVVVITSEKGLCGYFNSRLMATAVEAINKDIAQGIKISVIPVGKKAVDYFSKRGFDIAAKYSGFPAQDQKKIAGEIADIAIKLFLNGSTDEVSVFYNYFASMSRQDATLIKVLPFVSDQAGSPGDYLFEPDQESITSAVMYQTIVTDIVSCFLESNASEHAARTIAMQQATINADDMISALTMLYNKVRQASITREIIEVVSSAEALK